MFRAPLGSVEEDNDFESDGSDIDKVNYAMYEAAETGDKRLVRQMLEQGDNNFNDCMIHAAANGHLNIVELMIGNGANVQHQNYVQYFHLE